MARVLLAEDEPNIGAIIVFKLEREGHAVRWERDPTLVFQVTAEWKPDLVLLDSSLPGADVVPLLQELSRHCAVAVLTEFRDTSTPARARAAGARATVEKPFKPTQLARLVAQLSAAPAP